MSKKMYCTNRSLETSDDGVETFYPSSPPPSNNASAGSTPQSGSPLLDGCSSPVPCLNTRTSSGSGGIFSHLKSSRGKNASKEDLSAISSGSPTIERGKNDSGGASSKRQSFDIGPSSGIQEKRSPLPTSKHHEANKHKHGVSSGLSCLTSTTTDEESPPPPVPHVSTKPSPDKRGITTGTGSASLSPTMQSISDIFAKQASSKVTGKVTTGLSPGISPFSTRKTESPSSISEGSFAGRRISFPGNDELSKGEETGSPDASGKKTPEGVLRGQGVGHGNNPDLMAEIKEKRASMIPKGAAHTEYTEKEISPSSKIEEEKEKGNLEPTSNNSVFGRVRLR